MKPVFSILVPVCNVEKYLRQCLDSLLGQNFTDIEILCINDGSTDGSEEILREYAAKDARIVLTERENRGYGATMNEALDKASGDYISIVEPDDYLDADAYAKYYEDIQANREADVVKYSYWDYLEKDDSTSLQPAAVEELEFPEQMVSITEFPELLFYHPSIWSCVYRREFLMQNKIRFVEAKGAGWVDNPFFIQVMCLAQRILLRKNKVYYYRQGHIEASSNLKDCRIPLARIQNIQDFLEKENIEDDRILFPIYKRILNYIGIVRNCGCYEEAVAEPMIQNIQARIKPEGVFFGDFNSEEEKILSTYMNGSNARLYRRLEQELGKLADTDGRQWAQLEDHRLRLDGIDAKIGEEQDSIGEVQAFAGDLQARIQSGEERIDELYIQVRRFHTQMLELHAEQEGHQRSLLEHYDQLEQQQRRLEGELEAIRASRSYRIGRMVTWLPRKIKQLFKKS